MMKPSTYIKQVCLTQEQALNLALEVLDAYLSVEEVKHVLNGKEMP